MRTPEQKKQPSERLMEGLSQLDYSGKEYLIGYLSWEHYQKLVKEERMCNMSQIKLKNSDLIFNKVKFNLLNPDYSQNYIEAGNQLKDLFLSLNPQQRKDLLESMYVIYSKEKKDYFKNIASETRPSFRKALQSNDTFSKSSFVAHLDTPAIQPLKEVAESTQKQPGLEANWNEFQNKTKGATDPIAETVSKAESEDQQSTIRRKGWEADWSNFKAKNLNKKNSPKAKKPTGNFYSAIGLSNDEVQQLQKERQEEIEDSNKNMYERLGLSSHDVDQLKKDQQDKIKNLNENLNKNMYEKLGLSNDEVERLQKERQEEIDELNYEDIIDEYDDEDDWIELSDQDLEDLIIEDDLGEISQAVAEQKTEKIPAVKLDSQNEEIFYNTEISEPDAAAETIQMKSPFAATDYDLSVFPKTEKMPVMKTVAESKEVLRSQEMVAIGDLDGSYKKFKKNLLATGVMNESGDWIAGNRKVVFIGDIIADRTPEGFKILEAINGLRKQAEASGGHISIIAGNHEKFMLDFLLKPTPADPKYNPVLQCFYAAQGIGLAELLLFANPPLKKEELNSIDSTVLLSANNEGRLDRKVILKNMNQSPEGKMILDEICKMKLCDISDGILYVHTDPTQEMLELIADQGVNKLNANFQNILKNVLINGKDFPKNYDSILNTFLQTNNRTFVSGNPENDLSSDLLMRLKEQLRVKSIVFGHSALPLDQKDQTIHGMQFINIDYGKGDDEVAAVQFGKKLSDIRMGQQIRNQSSGSGFTGSSQNFLGL